MYGLIWRDYLVDVRFLVHGVKGRGLSGTHVRVPDCPSQATDSEPFFPVPANLP